MKIPFPPIIRKKPEYLKRKLLEFKATNEPILIAIDKGIYHRVYFGESSVLRQLRYYPYVVLGVVGLFIIVSYFAFNFSRRAEQNQVWVGLAKETAHQLGTPITITKGGINEVIMETSKAKSPSMPKVKITPRTTIKRLIKVALKLRKKI